MFRRLEPVAHRGLVTGEQPGQIDVAEIVEPGRQSDVTVVEPDHAETMTGEKCAESVGPGDELLTHTHDQEHHPLVGIAELVVTGSDAIGLYERQSTSSPSRSGVTGRRSRAERLPVTAVDVVRLVTGSRA
ncbi:hypothetical protein ABZ912_37855 [Nonomuraea angiospora]|uniref:hypothetical protein n=1 Tax=Nonomuraea angiospora TaxID=46172 RepID=UPI0033D29B79